MVMYEPMISEPSYPVFHDPRGNRKWRLAALLLTASMLITATLQIILPMINMPLYVSLVSNDPGYSRRLLEKYDATDMPILGKGGADVLTRMCLVMKNKDGASYLADPFSGEMVRALHPGEVEEIGNHQLVLDRFGEAPDHTLMLTFDDGPDPVFTPKVLDILAQNQVKATFFDIGENIADNPEVFRRIIAEGHMVGNHTYTHLDEFVDNTDERDRSELIKTDRIMRATASYSSPIWRLPEGNPDKNPLAILTAQQLGYLQVDFDLDTNDWRYEKPGETIPMPELDGKGHIVLMHDAGGDRTNTLSMLNSFIQEAKAQGYSFATLAPIIPDGFKPGTVEPDVVDQSVKAYSFATQSLPEKLLHWLFVFGVSSVIIMSVCIEWPMVVYCELRRRRRKPDEGPVLPTHSVSVIVPAYNEEECLTRTLDTLRKSDYPVLEVIVVNDGSKDKTLAVAQNYAREWDKLRVVDQKNAGKPAALNNGIHAAKGDILVLLDGDTMFETGAITALVKPFDDPDVGAVAGQIKVSNRHQNYLTMWQSLEYASGIGVTRTAQERMNSIMVVPGACGSWRKAALLRAGCFTEDTLAEDSDMAMSLRRNGWKIVQATDAVGWTEAPWTVTSFARQRLRWKYGQLQALYKHRRMMFNPRYGWLGFVAMPYAVLSVLIPWLFMIPAYVSAALLLINGYWQPVALFGGFIFAVQFITAALAMWALQEKDWKRHLILVPLYRPVYEMLQVFVLYMSTFKIAMGGMRKFYRPPRMAAEPVAGGIGELTSPDRLTEIP